MATRFLDCPHCRERTYLAESAHYNAIYACPMCQKALPPAPAEPDGPYKSSLPFVDVEAVPPKRGGQVAAAQRFQTVGLILILLGWFVVCCALMGSTGSMTALTHKTCFVLVGIGLALTGAIFFAGRAN